jgi:hypothetical protein
MKKYNKKGEYVGVNPFLQETYHAEPEEKFYACFTLSIGLAMLIVMIVSSIMLISWWLA